MVLGARRTQALLAGVAAACLVSLCSLLAAGRAVAQPTYTSLLPMARGQLLILVGTPPQWLPESGVSTSLTLFSGLPAHSGDLGDDAWVAVQNAGQRCAATAAGDHQTLLSIPSYYAHTNLISAHPHSLWRGAGAGDYAVTLPSIVIHQHGHARACVWLARTTRERGLVLSQKIHLLNGLFAASVSAVPSASTGIGGAYTLNAIDVDRPFTFTVTTIQCGARYADASGAVANGQLATESVAIETNPCVGDGSAIAFTHGGIVSSGGSFATLTYTDAQAIAAPPQIATLGACELDPIALVPLADAIQYVEAVGCRIRRLLLAPYNPGLPRGAVIEAQVNGGLAEIAPRRTSVDLELNGRPVTTATRQH